ncbi:MAG: DUF4167 domain-containing protein [Rhodospirillales bacterium]
MKQGSNNRRSRSRGSNKRNSGGGGGGKNHFESNGPDVKIRGNARQVQEKYQALARDAASAGDRVTSEAYLQFAEHYYRVSNPEGGSGKAQGQEQGQNQDQKQRQNKPQRVSKPQARPAQKPAAVKAPDDDTDAVAPETLGEAEVIDTSPAALAAVVSKREAAEAEARDAADAPSDITIEPAAS